MSGSLGGGFDWLGSLFSGGGGLSGDAASMFAQLPATPTATTAAGSFDPIAAGAGATPDTSGSSWLSSFFGGNKNPDASMPADAQAMLARLPGTPTTTTAGGQFDPIAAASEAAHPAAQSGPGASSTDKLLAALKGVQSAIKPPAAGDGTPKPVAAPQTRGASPQQLQQIVADLKRKQLAMRAFGLQSGAFAPRGPGGLLGSG